jgi:preprotein translocase subunit SecD
MSGLNIAAKRKVSLNEFAEGWDDCFVMVKVPSEKNRQAYALSLNKLQAKIRKDIKASQDEEPSEDYGTQVEDLQRSFCLDHIVSGAVMTTNDDGTTELVNFTKDDVPTVVEALGFTWLQRVVSVATGADRLKAMTN